MEASAVPRVAPAGAASFASPGLLRLLSDDRLVALIRDGNANAFEALYDRHHRAILSFCRHMLGGADEAEDAVQHTFLAAYRDLISSRKPIQLRAWLFTIARNRCLTILRARRETALEFEEPATDGLAAQVQRRQDLRDLVLDINHLPDDQRAALVLAEMGALSHDEIGSVIGVPSGKVKALVYQARESLLASRAARDTDCDEIREQLATMRGGALRRTTLRRHLRECQGCREYRRAVESQRRRIAVILPVVPTIALREAVLGVTAGGAVAGGVAPAVIVGIVVVVACGVADFFLGRRVRAWGYAERDDDLLVRRGVMFRRLSVIPYGRMQFVDVTAGPIERSFGLATVRMHTAAAASDARVPGLPAAEAARLRDQLTSLGEARAAGL